MYFSIAQLRAERWKFVFISLHSSYKSNSSRSLNTTKICPALHGGPLDYPKVSPTAAAETCAVWDRCYLRLEAAIGKRPPPASANTMSDEEVYEKLTGDSIRDVL